MTGARTPTLEPEARLERVHDGDTYLMLLDLRGMGLDQGGCETAWIRLRDYSARELRDTAATDPKGLGRVDGPTAAQIAAAMLHGATQITVELKGPDTRAGDSFGRWVGWVWIDGASLGAALLEHQAVAHIAAEG